MDTQNENNTSSHVNDVELMNYYQNEFMYRHTHYWNLIVKFFLLTIIITILPLTSAIFGIELKDITDKNVLLCFPLLGLITALFGFLIIRKEADRINAVNKAKYRINKRLPEDCQYVIYEEKESKKWQTIVISNLSLIAEMLIIICVALFIAFLY